jgi:hypothetical protein
VLSSQTLVNRRRFKEHDKGRAPEPIEGFQRAKPFQHVHRQRLRLFRVEQVPKAPWQQLIDTSEVNAPDLTVLIEAVDLRRRKMERH